MKLKKAFVFSLKNESKKGSGDQCFFIFLATKAFLLKIKKFLLFGCKLNNKRV
jgi:hypothetical protein